MQKSNIKNISVFSVPRWQILIRSKRDAEAQSYEKISEYRNTHDPAEHREETKPAKFKVDIRSEVTYYADERSYQKRLRLLLNGVMDRRIRF
jgi:hypothetical protein